MKKVILFLAIAIGLSSCIAVDNEDKANRATKTFEVSSNDWEYGYFENPNGYFSYTLPWSRLDSYLLGDAVINVYYIDRDGNYRQLPYVIYQQAVDEYGDAIYYEDGQPMVWQELIEYSYRAGKITFNVTYSDFYYDNIVPIPMKFYAVMMW